jgi:hypothetical protein
MRVCVRVCVRVHKSPGTSDKWQPKHQEFTENLKKPKISTRPSSSHLQVAALNEFPTDPLEMDLDLRTLPRLMLLLN